ncbi:MAG: hypothetical protein JRI23_04150 [Deltaproteobacteria bacterium]|jgi:hypothetical protein|nr:hypothetical protein [Deltaproteobacteria bacterium]MBW2530719.1 hypothetical protein [Deltaproteobacteria bacterium]
MTLVAAATAQPAPSGDDDSLGQVGAPCSYFGDCASHLTCVNGACVSRGATPSCKDPGGCASTTDPSAPAPGNAAPGSTSAAPAEAPPSSDKRSDDDGDGAPSEWERFRLGVDNHFLFGLAGGWGLSVPMAADGTTGGVIPSAHGAVRVGGLFDLTELALEVSPMTYWLSTKTSAAFAAHVTIGQLAELDERLFWPGRFGAGLLVVPESSSEAAFLARLDLIGLAFNYGHLLFDFALPSFRIATDFDTGAVFSWLGTVNVSWVL